MDSALNIMAMASNLREGLADLKRLHDRIRYRLGKVTSKADCRDLGYEERRNPLDEMSLRWPVNHTTRHLNWMWNERYMTDQEIRTCSSYETGRFPVDLIEGSRSQKDDDGMTYYDRFLVWKGRQVRQDVPCVSLKQYVARIFLADPRYRVEDAHSLWKGGVFYPDFIQRVQYCKNRKRGWEDISESVGEALREAAYERQNYLWDALPENIKGAIKRGDPTEFVMQLAIAGYRLTRQWLRIVVAEKGWKLLENLILRSDEIFKIVTPRRLLLKICADGRYEDKVASRLVKALESRFPCLAASVVDVFGDTPLWYTLYRYQRSQFSAVGWKEESSRLCSTLVYRLGYDPNRKNNMGLTWRSVKYAMK